MRSEMQCGSIWWRMHPSDFTNTPADFMLLSSKLLSGTMGHRAQLQRQEEEGGLGLLGGVRQGTESLAWLPVGIPNAFRAWSLIAWCLTQSLFLKGSWQTNDFFFQLSFLNILILSLLFDAVRSSSCMQKARRRAWKCIIQGTQKQLFDRLLLFLLTPGKCRDLAPCESHSGLLSQMLYTGISRRLLLYLCGLTRSSLWPRALECQQRLAVIARKCTVCQIIV